MLYDVSLLGERNLNVRKGQALKTLNKGRDLPTGGKPDGFPRIGAVKNSGELWQRRSQVPPQSVHQDPAVSEASEHTWIAVLSRALSLQEAVASKGPYRHTV